MIRFLVLCVVMASSVLIAHAEPYQEPDFFKKQVLKQQLPPVQDRLPMVPAVADFSKEYKTIGRYGGALRMLLGRSKDTRLLYVYGAARLIAYAPDLSLKADLLERYEVEEDRIFTFYLRKGHKWSDGHPFTTEDFRYYWEDMINHPDWDHMSLPAALKVKGQGPRVHFIDDYTVRYEWDAPNPYFLPALAGPNPTLIYRPAHYLKKFHADYRQEDVLKYLIALTKQRNWVALHFKHDRLYKNDNPDMPTLQPWVPTTKSPATRYEFVRNPYFHRVDPEGQQLPYIDEVFATITGPRLISAKSGSGESDLQARALAFGNYTFLKQGEKNHPYRVRLWREGIGSHLSLYPNMNTLDEQWRRLFQDVRMRRALSLGINRHELNQVIYFGLAEPAANYILQDSPLYQAVLSKRWIDFDLKKANEILDELGLVHRNSQGIRLLPDGRPMELIVELSGDNSEQADVMALIHDSWLKLGIKTYTKAMQREVFRKRVITGQSLMTLWTGVNNGLPTPMTPPEEWVPTDQYQLQWPKWGMYFETNTRSGEITPDPMVRRLVRLGDQWLASPDLEQRMQIWRDILDIHTDQVFTIGLIANVPQPVVVHSDLHNVPKEAVYNWATSAHFGLYRPDTFWFSPDYGGGQKQ